MSFIGNKVIDSAKKYNVSIDAQSSWNLRLIGLKATTNKFEYDIKLEKSDITGHGENFIYGLTSGSVEIENLFLEIHIGDGDDLNKILNEIQNKIKNNYYSFIVKSLIINIYKKNEEQKDILNNEILFSNINLTKQQNSKNYSAEITINKNKKTSFFITLDKANTENYELNAKLEDEDSHCYIYDSKKGGNINCVAQNLLISLQDLGFDKIKDEFLNKILNKRLSFKADIKHNNGIQIDGNFMINDNLGKVNFNDKDNILNVEFDSINFDKTADDVKELFNNSEDDKKNEQVMMMSGKENKILSNAKKPNVHENINSLNKIVLYLVCFTKNTLFKTNIKVNNATFNDIKISNFNAEINKKENGRVEVKKLSMNFGEDLNDRIIIEDKEDEYDNLFIYGEKIKNLSNLFNIKSIKQNDYKYILTGRIETYINYFALKNISLSVENQQIIGYNFENSYEFESKKTTKTKKIHIKNIELHDFFDMPYLYKNLYNKFDKTQQEEKQDAVFWKKLFKKRGQEISHNNEFEFMLNNVVLYNKKINNFALNYEDNNKLNKLNIVSKGDIIDGNFDFDVKNIDGKETIKTDIDFKTLDISNIEQLYNDVKQATNRELKEILFEDKDYNIPSFVGINGDIDLKIDYLKTDRTKINNVNGKFSIFDGVINSEKLKFVYKNGKLDVNVALSLRGRPEIQMAFAGSGLDMDSLLNSPLDGYVSFQCNLKSFGFNPVKFISNASGKGKVIVQNLKIPNFDLLNMSKDVMVNGVRKIDYKKVVSSNNLFFSKGEGNLLIEGGIIKSDIAFSRELVSGSAEFEYNFMSKVLRKMSGSFVAMMVRKPLEQPFPIYIPFACNGDPERPDCMIDWRQLDETVTKYVN